MTTATRTTADVLREMRDLLAEPERWTQGGYARTSSGDLVMGNDSSAVRWCIAGAEHRVGGALVAGVYSPVVALVERLIDGNLEDWNDAPERTHAEVLDLLDRAIEAAS